MFDSFEFISPDDKPGLIAISNPERRSRAQTAMTDLDYKIHPAESHEDFRARFAKTRYQMVIIDELFCCSLQSENSSLSFLQNSNMSPRRHATVIFISSQCQTMNAMQAFQHSVHAVVHPNDLDRLRALIQQLATDVDHFYKVFRECQLSYNL